MDERRGGSPTPERSHAVLRTERAEWVGASPAGSIAIQAVGRVSRHADYLRWLYRGGRPNRFARLQNRASAVVFGAGIWPRRLGALEVRGRRSGRTISFPVVIAREGGERFVVSMLGEQANWVRNVRAAHGHATLRHGRREIVHLNEVGVDDRPAILRRYLAVAREPGPKFPVDRHAPLEELRHIAAQIPVFRITTSPPAADREEPK